MGRPARLPEDPQVAASQRGWRARAMWGTGSSTHRTRCADADGRIQARAPAIRQQNGGCSRADGRHPPALTREPALALLSLIHISEPTRLGMISYAVFCL